MTKTVSNTLTRWHKVAERVKTASQELQQSMLRSLQAGQGLDFDTFLVRKDGLRQAAEKATGEQLSLYLALQDTLFVIRRALAESNVKFGVSGLLNDIERAKQELSIYERFLETSSGAMSVTEYEDLARRRAGNESSTRQMYGVSVDFLNGTVKADLEQRRAAARITLNQLSDRLADANASKLSLEINAAVAEFVGI